jgi:hypothetical protein
VSHPLRALCALVLAAFVLPTVAQAAPRMPVGFYDDASFRWSADRLTNLATAASTGATVIHTNANWATIAPRNPRTPRTATTRLSPRRPRPARRGRAQYGCA